MGNAASKNKSPAINPEDLDYCSMHGYAHAPYEQSEFSKDFDRLFHASLGRMTSGISPASIALAYADWLLHLSFSPGKRLSLMQNARHQCSCYATAVTQAMLAPRTTCPAVPEPNDHRFKEEDWQDLPFRLLYQGFLLTEQWWEKATVDVDGVSHHHEQVVSFVTRQFLDIFSPSNFLLTNPSILKITMAQGGGNLLQGMANFLEDAQRTFATDRPIGTEAYLPGKTVAITPGEVIYRNELIELIQYYPTTDKVQAEPILIVPAWIMKYYILDLSPHNSLVKYLIDNGYTVFMISWRNPGSESRNLGLNDYLERGIFDAVHEIQSLIPSQKINAIGYCIGGTLLSLAGAYYHDEKDNVFNTITLLAAQTDFSEAGELSLFIDESQVTFLENVMWAQGYLDAKKMAGFFQILRSNDLIWSRLIQNYLKGARAPMTDLQAWSTDATRMPYRMHSEYLRKLFLNNELFEGHYKINGHTIVLSDIHTPIFAVATEWDHVAPWHSVYKINLLADTSMTFVLTSGGHNVGIVNEPGKPGRHYRKGQFKVSDTYIDPDTWFEETSVSNGSWWPELLTWLKEHSQQDQMSPPSMAKSLCKAPGTYVL